MQIKYCSAVPVARIRFVVGSIAENDREVIVAERRSDGFTKITLPQVLSDKFLANDILEVLCVPSASMIHMHKTFYVQRTRKDTTMKIFSENSYWETMFKSMEG